MRNYVSGKFVSQGYYSCFVPETIDHDWALDDIETINLLGQAERAIGKLDMFSEYVPNIDLFIRMHVVKEATQSAKIEGTQTNFEEALKSRDEIPQGKREDWDEVQNYIEALWLAMEKMSELPLSSRLIKTIHKTLIQGVRGEHKFPGEFRTSQNWIGGASLKDATFIPPAHNMVPELMSDIEKFAHNQSIALPELIKIAIIHYQFETIHPFCDGNGRVGRLIIPIYLVEKGLLKSPALYISDFFERNRKLYYDNLMAARTDNNLRQWIKFFLVGIIEIANKGAYTFDSILKLQKKAEGQINSLKGKSYDANKVVGFLYQRPFIDAGTVVKLTEKTPASAYALIKDLEKLGILVEITGNKRDRKYAFAEYLGIFNG